LDVDSEKTMPGPRERSRNSESVHLRHEVQNKEVQTAGSWAYARGVYQARLTPRQGGSAIPIDGKYMTILKKQNDGAWKLYRDMFNSNVPPGKSD
jgi:ketosteroid isomerase-like protein